MNSRLDVVNLPEKTEDFVTHKSKRQLSRWTGALLVTCWAYSVVPATLSLEIYGPVASDITPIGRVIDQHGIYLVAENISMITIFICALGVVITGVLNNQRVTSFGFIPAMFIILTGMIAYMDGQIIFTNIAVMLAIAIACALGSLSMKELSILGWLTFLTAVISLISGINGTGLVFSETWGVGKSIIDLPVLTGPFSHPNTLGLNTALGIPFIFRLKSRIWRVIALCVASFVLVWSSSRTSMIAVSVGVVIACILCYEPIRQTMKWFVGIIPVLISVMLPFIGLSDEAFTGRGAIWHITREVLSDHWILGIGRDAFQVGGSVSLGIGFTPITAHNMWLSQWAFSGILSAVFVVIIILRMEINVVLRGWATFSLVAFAIALPVIGSCEAIQFDLISSNGYLAPLVFILSSRMLTNDAE